MYVKLDVKDERLDTARLNLYRYHAAQKCVVFDSVLVSVLSLFFWFILYFFLTYIYIHLTTLLTIIVHIIQSRVCGVHEYQRMSMGLSFRFTTRSP